MEPKTGFKLTTVCLLILFVLVLVMGYFLCIFYIDKNDLNIKLESLSYKITNLENSSNILQKEIARINSGNKQSTTENNVSKLEGSYTNSDEPESFTYTFSGNTVVYTSLHRQEGTYTIVDDTVKITYTKAFGPEGEPLDEIPDGETEELKIVDENTLTLTKGEYTAKFTKN